MSRRDFALRRPLVRLTLAFAAGVALGHLSQPPPSVALVAGFACLAAAGWALAGRQARGGEGAGWTLLLAAVLAGGVFAAALAWQRLGPGPADTAGGGGSPPPARWVRVEGRVASEPRPAEWGCTFLVETAGAGRYWRAGETLYVSARGEAADPPPVSGALVLVQGFLERPRAPGNPGQFDFRLYLATLGVRYTVSAYGVAPLQAPDGGDRRTVGLRLAALCRGVRDALVERMNRALAPDEAALLAGLLFGDTSRLPDDAARDFRRSGVFHILAVSGSNVAFVAGGFWLVSRPVLAALGLRRGRARRVLWPATAVMLIAYAVMAGLGPSVTRATLMAEAGLLYLWLGRRRDVSGPLCLAALVMLCRRPLVILDVGFQLSFVATLGLFLVYPSLAAWTGRTAAGRLPGWPGRAARPLIEATLVSVAAQVAVAPILAVHFGEVSVAGLLANAIVVPLAGLAVTLGLAAGAVALGGAAGGLASAPLFFAASLLLRGMTATARFFAGLPFASVVVGSPPPWVVAGYYAALLWILGAAKRTGAAAPVLSPGGLRRLGPVGRRLAAVSVVVLALVVARTGVSALAGPEAEVVFLDVGQGDAVFARLPGGLSLLVDGGPAGAGDRVIARYLRHRGQSRLDLVFISHFHDDHVGGLLELLLDPGISVGEVVVAAGGPGTDSSSPAPLAQAVLAQAGARGVPVRTVAAGSRLEGRGGNRVLAVLWPAGGDFAMTGDNNGSLVLRLLAGRAAVLLPGDLETEGEMALLSGTPFPLDSAVLKVAHHGSADATGPSFLAAVRPWLAVISVGPNLFGHPSPGVIERLGAYGAIVFRTDLDGAVILRIREKAVTVTGYRSGREVQVQLSPAGRGEASAGRGEAPAGCGASPGGAGWSPGGGEDDNGGG